MHELILIIPLPAECSSDTCKKRTRTTTKDRHKIPSCTVHPNYIVTDPPEDFDDININMNDDPDENEDVEIDASHSSILLAKRFT
ncbi:hypothetical protein J3R83DRAFT_11313 [Lanmaoa asiatica]|nr:hypothetical protein J3R83DRAFT_11313 [Lanmaoa asiatica]